MGILQCYTKFQQGDSFLRVSYNDRFEVVSVNFLYSVTLKSIGLSWALNGFFLIFNFVLAIIGKIFVHRVVQISHIFIIQYKKSESLPSPLISSEKSIGKLSSSWRLINFPNPNFFLKALVLSLPISIFSFFKVSV